MDKKLLDIFKDGIIMTVTASVVAIVCNYGFASLKGAGSKADPLVNAVVQSNQPFIQELLSEKNLAESHEDRVHRVNRSDDFGRSPLMWSAYLNLSSRKRLTEADPDRAATARLLLDAGADCNQRDKDGWNALMWASWSGLTQVADLLVTHGTDLAATDQRGQTALMIAALRGNTAIVKLLLSHGASRNADDVAGETARDYVGRAMKQYPDRKADYSEIKALL